MPTKTKTGVICLLEFKRMSDVTSHYIVRAKTRRRGTVRISQIGGVYDYAVSRLEGRTSQLHRRGAVAQREGAQEKLE